MWSIPEAFFPSKKFDVLPPRLAQPLLTYSRNYSSIGSNVFDPIFVIKALYRLDQLTLANRKIPPNSSSQQQQQQQHQPTITLLQRDAYVYEWLTPDGRSFHFPRDPRGIEYYPVCVRGAGRPLSEGEEQILNVGILHVPNGAGSLLSSNVNTRYSTLTLLPPEPHILLPLLIKAAEAEHRHMKKAPEKTTRNILMDETWRSEFRAYMFRIPPYYHNALRRCLRPVLPSSLHNLLSADGSESLVSQCFSKVCLQKIRNGEQASRDMNERLERQEAELRRRGVLGTDNAAMAQQQGQQGQQQGQLQQQQQHDMRMLPHVGHGQYDPRATTTSYLAALRTMQPPWRSGAGGKATNSAAGVDDGTAFPTKVSIPDA